MLHAGLAWRHFDRGKQAFYPIAIAALEVCRGLADDLGEPEAAEGLLEALSERFTFFESEPPYLPPHLLS